jgi:hypothetical protein
MLHTDFSYGAVSILPQFHRFSGVETKKIRELWAYSITKARNLLFCHLFLMARTMTCEYIIERLHHLQLGALHSSQTSLDQLVSHKTIFIHKQGRLICYTSKHILDNSDTMPGNEKAKRAALAESKVGNTLLALTKPLEGKHFLILIYSLKMKSKTLTFHKDDFRHLQRSSNQVTLSSPARS